MLAPTQVIFVVLLLAVFPAVNSKPFAVGGGTQCVGCTLATSLIEQLAERDNKTIEEFLDVVCKLFPTKFDEICEYFVDNYGAEVIKLFDEGHTPDEVCLSISFCSLPQCRLWAPSGLPLPLRNAVPPQPKYPEATPWDWILELLAPLINNSEPVLDIDGDLFSFEPELRGTNWRGRDCDDFDSKQYPGRKVTGYPPEVDHNCNGIFGKNGTDYEKLFCNNSGQLGAMVVGDSAGAHFSIPPDWMNATAINDQTFSNLLEVLSNELDWPQRSAATGFIPSTSEYTVHSLYLNLRNRNRCNHRDYQNVCKNGLRSGPLAKMATSVARKQTEDFPVIMTIELIGNDVCSGHPDYNHYTPPAEFRQNIMNTLAEVDAFIPAGSHIILLGLAQGGILWDTMNARIHPIGTTYAAVYDYLNCLEVSPCWTWMNSNATVRTKGNDWAAMLSNVYADLAKTAKFKNFDLAYYPFPLEQIWDIWRGMGGQFWELIEPTDGFHPSQISNWITADYMWGMLQKDHPDWLGPVNPYNSQIEKIFGDQNGY